MGGYTTIIDMPLQNEPAMTNAAIFDRKVEKVDCNAYTDYCFWGGMGAICVQPFLAEYSALYF